MGRIESSLNRLATATREHGRRLAQAELASARDVYRPGPTRRIIMVTFVRRLRSILAAFLVGSASMLPSCASMGGGGGSGMHYLIDPPSAPMQMAAVEDT